MSTGPATTLTDLINNTALPKGWDRTLDASAEDVRLAHFLLTNVPDATAEEVNLDSPARNVLPLPRYVLATYPSLSYRANPIPVIEAVAQSLTHWADTDLLRDFTYAVQTDPNEPGVEFGVRHFETAARVRFHHDSRAIVSATRSTGGTLAAIAVALVALDGWRRATAAAKTLAAPDRKNV